VTAISPFTPVRRTRPVIRLALLPALCVALAAGVGWLLPHGRPGVPTTLFLIAVLGSAFMAGFWSGMVASVLAIVALDTLFLVPTWSFGPVTVDDATLLVVFLVAAALAAWALQRLQRAGSAAELARNRAAALAAVTGDLAETLDVHDVGRVLVDHMTTGLGAKAAGVFLVDASGVALTALASAGYPDLLMEQWRTFPVSADVPAAEVVRERHTILLGSLRERLGRYGATSRDRPAMGAGALAAAPLLSAGSVVGSVTLSFADDHRFSAADDRFLQILALQGANAIERARLREEERLRQERTAFLADASRALAASLDYEQTLDEVARLAVPRFADWAVVDLLAEDGGIVPVAVVHRDPEVERWARDHRDRVPPSLSDPAGPAAVIRAGRPEFHPALEHAELDDQGGDDGTRQMLRRLRMRSVMIVPLTGREKALGAVSLVYGESERHYRAQDLAVAQDLAARAAAAVDNARLFRAEAQARSAVELAEARLRILSAASRALASSLDLDETLREVSRLAVQHLADGAAIYLAGEGGDLQRLAMLPVDVDRGAASQRQEGVDQPERSEPSHVMRAFATGQPHVLGDRGDAVYAGGPEQEAITAMALPLVIGQRAVGVLALTWNWRRAVPPDEQLLAEELARRMARAIENARLYEDRDRTARALQRDLLPRWFPDVPGLEIEARYRPSSAGNLVGGDFYDVFEARPGRWVAAIGDVCGKGPEAAAVMGIVRFTLRALALHETRPVELLSLLNGSMLGHGLRDRFVTIGCAVMERVGEAFRIRLCLAGHPRPVHALRSGEMELLGEHGMPIGLIPDPVLHETQHRVEPGDTLVLYTDGLDTADVSAEDRVAGLIRDGWPSELKEIVDTLIEAAGEHGRRLQDDVAILALRVTE
jgi:GAF domain-containing protein